MSGVLNALAAGGSSTAYSVTIEDVSFGVIFGYSLSEGDGAITPSSLKGTTIDSVTCRLPGAGSPHDIEVVLRDTVAQSFLSAVVVQRTDGAIARYVSADATFQQFGLGPFFTSWSWGSNGDVWTAAGIRFVMLYF